MKRLLVASAAAALMASAAHADMKVGVLMGFTGPIESLTPNIAAAAELAMKEASDSGLFLGGKKVVPV
ncbi:MAG: branched-chain amino acid ABC transporter substrate-binding protein, partial [Defluviicoccus sp.]|nr:branched-chain amino acid ABC transporter substrate-binding protein [Defluviicoccus sp.]